MYFLTLDTTTRMSSSETGATDLAGATDVEGAAGRGGGAMLATRGGGAEGDFRITGGGTGAGASRASSWADPGAIASTAQASRWRKMDTWLSRHGTLQKTSFMRARLQVDT